MGRAVVVIAVVVAVVEMVFEVEVVEVVAVVVELEGKIAFESIPQQMVQVENRNEEQSYHKQHHHNVHRRMEALSA